MSEPEAISIRALRNDIASVIKRVEAGSQFDVTRHGHAVARLSPAPGERRPGRLSDIWELRDESGIDYDLLDLVRSLRSDVRDPYERYEEHHEA